MIEHVGLKVLLLVADSRHPASAPEIINSSIFNGTLSDQD